MSSEAKEVEKNPQEELGSNQAKRAEVEKESSGEEDKGKAEEREKEEEKESAKGMELGRDPYKIVGDVYALRDRLFSSSSSPALSLAASSSFPASFSSSSSSSNSGSLREAFFLALAQLSHLYKHPELLSPKIKDLFNSVSKHYLLGHLYNVLDEYHKEAEENLTKAVKLNPRHVDAWNSLGECFWKKGDLNTARICFTNSLDRLKNKTSLRSLSMVLRQLGEDDKSRRSNISQSVELAKQAVAMDVEDGISWS